MVVVTIVVKLRFYGVSLVDVVVVEVVLIVFSDLIRRIDSG